MFNTTNNGTDVPSDILEELSEQELYQAGAQHFKDRDYDSARTFLERYLERNPSDATALHLFARVYYHQNRDLDKAEECLKKALELDHSSLTMYLETLGIIYLSQGRFKRAEEVFEYALSEDKKEDVRHTNTLEFHLDLARKKYKSSQKHGHTEGPAPEFLTTELGRLRTRSRQSLFLLPSILLHALILLLVGYLSTHNLPFKKDKEDFTYVEVEQPAPAPEEEAAPPEPSAARAAKAEKTGSPQKAPMPAPVSPQKEVRTADVGKGSSGPALPAPVKEAGPSGQRGTVGQKSISGVKGGAQGETLMAKAMPGDKGSQIKPHSFKGSEEDVDLVRKSLGPDTSKGSGATGQKEAAIGGLNERSGGAAAAGADGIFLGDAKTGKAEKWEKRHAELKGKPMEDRSAPKSTGGEKGMDLGNRKEKRFAANEEAGLMARRLGISTGPSSPAAANTRAGAPRSLDKGEEAAAGAGRAALSGISPSQGREALSSGKTRGSLGNEYSAEAISPVAGGERKVDLSGPTGRRFASAEGVPVKRGLDIQASGRPGTSQPGAPGGGARENIASLDRRSAGVAPGTGAAGLSAGRPGAEGYSRGPAAGKGVNSKALGGQPEGEGTGLSGFLEKTAKRVSDAFSMGGASGARQGSGPSGADLMRKGSLGISGSGGYSQSGSGQGSGGSGTGKGVGGVRLGSGERGSAAPGTGRAGTGALSGQARAGAVGGKKMTDAASVLGEPGSEGGRYASAGTRPRTGGIEKRSGVGRGTALAKNTLGPSVSIASPVSGRTNRITQVVTGSVSDSRIKTVTLTVNNDSRVVSVENGRFESTVSLGKGRNTITVLAFDLDGTPGKDIVVLDYAEPSEGAAITIASPRQGQVFDVSERSVVNVKGTIGDPEIKKAKLIFNGNPMDIVVNRGFFDQKVALVEEQNTILVEAVSPDGVASRSSLVTVNTMNVKPKDIMLILTWDKPHADLDLHVYGPLGGHTYYKSPNIYESKDAIAGGQLEQDAKGNFGPEVYTQDRADKGVYTVKSNYYYSGGDGDAHATLTVILYGDNPSRRIVHVFGPHLQVDTKNGEDTWEVTRIKMPEGIFLEE